MGESRKFLILREENRDDVNRLNEHEKEIKRFKSQKKDRLCHIETLCNTENLTKTMLGKGYISKTILSITSKADKIHQFISLTTTVSDYQPIIINMASRLLTTATSSIKRRQTMPHKSV